MVDRIVPAATAADRADAARLLGVADRAALVTEPFRQWVIEDRFAAGRPPWERAGAIVTRDVAPYETDEAAHAQRRPLAARPTSARSPGWTPSTR